MLTQFTSSIRYRWHPLWRLRQLRAFRYFQRHWDRTIFTRIPETDLRVAVKLLRDAAWILCPRNLEPEIRTAFALVLETLRPKAFWDIGANIGFYSWYVRRHPAVQQVIMFEPDPTNFDLITQTILRNALQDCKAMNLALADRNGKAPFLVDHVSGATGSLRDTSHPENKYSLHYAYRMSETIDCQMETVDRLVANGTQPPELIKIDVEGAEHLVLAGAKCVLNEHRPTVIMETSSLELVESLLTVGYKAFRIDSGNFLFCPATRESNLSPIRNVFPEYH